MTRTLPNNLTGQQYINSQQIWDDETLAATPGPGDIATSDVIYTDDNVEQHVLFCYSAGNLLAPVNVEVQYYVSDVAGWVTRDTIALATGVLSVTVYNFGQDATRLVITNTDVTPAVVSIHLRVKKTD